MYILGDGHILVNAEGGNIKVGDAITTSSTAGIGMKATRDGMTIGIAQESYNFAGNETKLIAVQYGLREYHDNARLDALQKENDELRSRLDVLEAKIK